MAEPNLKKDKLGLRFFKEYNLFFRIEKQNPIPKDGLMEKIDTYRELLGGYFSWCESKEGFDFWADLFTLYLMLKDRESHLKLKKKVQKKVKK